MPDAIQYIAGRPIRTAARAEADADKPGWPPWAASLARSSDSSCTDVTLYSAGDAVTLRDGDVLIREDDGRLATASLNMLRAARPDVKLAENE